MSNSGHLLDNAEVEFLLDASAKEENPAAPAAESSNPEQAVTMRGNLDQINLADIFQTLAMTKMEGVLRVSNPLEQRQVYCAGGYVRVLVPTRLIQRRIGHRLVQSGLITNDQLRSALMCQRKERLPLGEMLVKERLLTQDQIDEVAGVQVAEDLFALFTWNHGTFEFYKGEVTDPELRERFDACPEFEVSSLLLEVARRSDEWETILAALGSPDEVPIRLSDEAPPRQLTDTEYVLLHGADGRTTYRTLAEQTTQGLFEVARCARNLVGEGLLGNVADADLVLAASTLAESGMHKPAVMMLQTLRDRPGDRDLEVVRGMASVLDLAGERKLAGLTLLELAQMQTDGELALSLARESCTLAPHDAGTLSFLRTTLLAHSEPDSPELEKCTLTLLDALIDEGRIDNALEIVADARATGTAGPQVLQREAKARQKNRDNEGAAAAFDEVAAIYRERGDRIRLIETLEAILRLDRSRKDITKQLQKLRQTRTSRLIRIGALAVCVLLLGSTGLVVWSQKRFESCVRSAGEEIGALLRTGDRVGARERLSHWGGQLGEGEQIDDLRRQVDFADASELARVGKVARKRMNDRLTQAATLIGDGSLRGALDIYTELRQDPDLANEVDEVVATRLDAVLLDIDQTAKTMATRLPPEPSTLLDRRELVRNLTDLQTMCRPALYITVDELVGLYEGGTLPRYLPEERRQQIADAVTSTRDIFVRARKLATAYTVAMQRNDSQRRYDPMFKEAVRREETHDFPGALDLFRQLEKAEAADAELRAHFRDHVTRNATICTLMDALKKATEAADFATAQQQLRALKLAFTDVPFDRLVRLPLTIESQPAGALVTCNGKDIGRTPCTISFVPADPNRIAVSLPGFRPEVSDLRGAETGLLRARLLLQPQRTRTHENAVDAIPATDNLGRTFLADRGGNLTVTDDETGEVVWTYRSGDLSGLLSRVFLHDGHAVFTSLDGELRALVAENGRVGWTLSGLPTEIEPVQVGQYLAIAATDNRLCLVDMAARTSTHAPLPGSNRSRLLSDGRSVFAVTERNVTAFALPRLNEVWRRTLDGLGEAHAGLAGNALVVADDRGNVHCLDAQTGVVRWHRVEDAAMLGPPIADGDTVLLTSRPRIVRMTLKEGSGRRTIAMLQSEWAKAPVRIGSRLLAPTAGGVIEVLDIATGAPLYALEGSKRTPRILPWRQGVMIALPDRRLQFYPELR